MGKAGAMAVIKDGVIALAVGLMFAGTWDLINVQWSPRMQSDILGTGETDRL
jgi:hypothetical protein